MSDEKQELVPGDSKRTTARNGGSVTIKPNAEAKPIKKKTKPSQDETEGGDR